MCISIIIPVYNVSEYVENCLKSVMDQTYTDLECIIIDDASPDDSIPKCKRLIAEYQGLIRFSIIHHEKTGGLSAARNTGIKAAKGDYLFFLDSDDLLTPDCIEKLVMPVQKDPSIEMVQGKHISYRDGMRVKFGNRIVPIAHACTNEDVRRCFYHYQQFIVTAWNKLLKRSFVLKSNLFFWEGILFEDTPWTFNLLKHVTNAYFITDVIYHHKYRPKSIVTSAGNQVKAYHFRRIYDYILTNLTPGYEFEEYNHYGKRFAYAYTKYVRSNSEFDDLYRQWRLMGDKYGTKRTKLNLSIGHMLGKYKRGWMIMKILTTLAHPKQIKSALKVVLYRITDL